MGRFHTVAQSGFARLSGPSNRCDDQVLDPRVVRQTLCRHGQQAFPNHSSGRVPSHSNDTAIFDRVQDLADPRAVGFVGSVFLRALAIEQVMRLCHPRGALAAEHFDSAPEQVALEQCALND